MASESRSRSSTSHSIAAMPDDTDASLFAQKFSIPSRKADPLKWSKEWEKILPTLSASEDVYPVMRLMWNRGAWDLAKFSKLNEGLRARLCESQGVLVKLWNDTEEKGPGFVTAWLLLEEEERKRHLMKGLQDGCGQSSGGSDSRALCPEITLKLMLQRGGNAFIDCIRNYTDGVKNVGADIVYLLPSEWWKNAVDTSQPLSEEEVETFNLLSIQRNEFITWSLLHTAMSILHDLSFGSPGMNPVTDFIKSDGSFAVACSKTLSGVRDKPLVRCENCTKSPEEIGGNVKFMVCGSCKTKLDFAVHYCSQACQKEDWRNHKKNCGKQKVSKKLQGTAEDPFWAFPEMPDHLRTSIPISDRGGVSLNNIGFGTPHPSRPHSPALQRQVSLLTGNKEIDYYLFDELDRPIPVVLPDMWTKMSFRILRSDAMFSAEQQGTEAIAQHLIKVMGHVPGLSRERILDQFSKEYGGDMAAKVAAFERMGVRNGSAPGTTFLEGMTKGLSSSIPMAMGGGGQV